MIGRQLDEREREERRKRKVGEKEIRGGKGGEKRNGKWREAERIE